MRGKQSVADLVAKAHAFLSESEPLRALYDVGFFPPNSRQLGRFDGRSPIQMRSTVIHCPSFANAPLFFFGALIHPAAPIFAETTPLLLSSFTNRHGSLSKNWRHNAANSMKGP
jgi:hypothetical protein